MEPVNLPRRRVLKRELQMYSQTVFVRSVENRTLEVSAILTEVLVSKVILNTYLCISKPWQPLRKG